MNNLHYYLKLLKEKNLSISPLNQYKIEEFKDILDYQILSNKEKQLRDITEDIEQFQIVYNKLLLYLQNYFLVFITTNKRS